MPQRVVLDPTRVWVRHIKKGLSTDTGAVQVCGTWFTPQATYAVNGVGGWTKAEYEERLNEEGSFSITFPNDVGDDGIRHRDRFLYHTDTYYRPGDEWLELYRDDELLFVGTPTGGTLTFSEVTLRGGDGLELLKKARESLSAHWVGAPRDVFEAYTTLPTAEFAEPFDNALALPTGFTSAVSGGTVTPSAGYVLFTANAPAAGATNSVSIEKSVTTMRDFEWRSEWRLQSATNGTGAPPTGGFWLYQMILYAGNTAGATYETVMNFMVKYENRPGQSADEIGYIVVYAYTRHWDSTQIITPILKRIADRALPVDLAVVQRGRFMFFYLDGEAVGSRVFDPRPSAGIGTYDRYLCSHNVQSGSSTATTGTVSMQLHSSSFIVRKPFLLRGSDKGDRRIAGAPVSGGLIGTYKDDADLYTAVAHTSRRHYAFQPQRRLAYTARRQDAQVLFAATTFGGNLPVALTATGAFSVRWTGSVYLDLAANDIGLQMSTAGYGKMWVGKTGPNEEYLDFWTASNTLTGSSLRTWLGTSVSGWYPLVIEYNSYPPDASSGITVGWQNPLGGSVVAIPSTALSPQGIYENNSRMESHYEVLRDLMNSWAIQARVVPRQLESGTFPGQLIPRVREGRDTELIVTRLDGAVDPVSESDADDVVDYLLSDAAGLGRQGENIVVASLDHTQAKQHFMLHADQSSQPDLGLTELLSQRVRSMQSLRSSPWEQVSVRPRGQRDYLDSFPLTGAAALFDWKPGDGVRLDLPEIRVQDTTPRQITAVSRQLTRMSVSAPQVSFRQRPRGLRQVLRDFQRSFLETRRNAQGQIVVITSGAGANPGTANVPDNVCRMAFPIRDGVIVGAYFTVIYAVAGASTWQLNVNGTLIPFNPADGRSARYDITPWVMREGAGSNIAYTYRLWAYAQRLTGTGTMEYHLELHVRL